MGMDRHQNRRLVKCRIVSSSPIVVMVAESLTARTHQVVVAIITMRPGSQTGGRAWPWGEMAATPSA